jgi:hypothetical protein
MDAIIAKAEEVALANKEAEDAIAAMALAADDAAVLLGAASGRADDLRDAISGIAAATAPAGAALGGLDGRLDDLVMLSTAAVSELHDVRDAMAGVAVASMAMAAGTGTAAVATAQGGAAAARTYGWFRLTGNAIHWLIMGTLEIAATAVPAMVALGAAGAAMFQTFGHVYDVMSSLYTASGSLAGAFANSVGPLQRLGAAGNALRNAVAPDAYIIFGAAIETMTSHVGAFAGMAQQASGVLATFATKIVADLQGPAGAALAGFFNNAVKYMIQWGQVLGNLGHSFLNAVNSMWGVGQLLLDVLDVISRVLLNITSNPIGAWLIGVAAAMSAVYRYGRLLVTIFNWLGGSALVGAVKWAVGYGSALAGLAAEEGIVAAASLAMGDLMTAALGPVGIAIAAITIGLGLWYLATRKSADATDQLISKVQAMPPTVANLTSGIGSLTGALEKTAAAASHLGPTMDSVSSRLAGPQLAGKALQASQDMSKLTAAIEQQAQKLVALQIGLAQTGQRTGQVGAAMDAMAIQTALADSKIQATNQALDAYVGLLTGGTGAMASFTMSMSNLTTGTSNITTLLGASGTVTLSVKDFSKMLSQVSTTGAQAWQNFNQVITGSMQPMADWFRQAMVLGDASSSTLNQAVLDMVANLGKYAGSNQAAQAEVLGFARANGISASSFSDLMTQAGPAGKGMKDLTGLVNGTTIAMSNLSQAAKNVANALSSQESSAMAQAALAAVDYQGKVNALAYAIQRYGSNSPQAVLAAQAVAQAQKQAGQDAITAANQTTQASGQTVRAAQAAALAMKQQEQAAKNLQTYIDSMHGKTISVNTIFSSSGPQPTAQGTGGKYIAYAAGGYISGPGSKTSDSVPVMASHGEFMMQAAAVDHYGRGVMEALNARKLASGGPVEGPRSPAASLVPAGGGGGVTLNQSQVFQVKLDNTVIGSQQRTQTLTYFRRNPGNNLALRVR